MLIRWRDHLGDAEIPAVLREYNAGRTQRRPQRMPGRLRSCGITEIQAHAAPELNQSLQASSIERLSHAQRPNCIRTGHLSEARER
jgi:hypothetical protein